VLCSFHLACIKCSDLKYPAFSSGEQERPAWFAAYEQAEKNRLMKNVLLGEDIRMYTAKRKKEAV
jgi:hypothetical protein